MKTTVEVDEHKLKRVMDLCNISTRREAIDRALTELERQAITGLQVLPQVPSLG